MSEKSMTDKSKKPIFKKVWFWVLVVIIIFGIAMAIGGEEGAKKVGDNAGQSGNYSQEEEEEKTEFKVGDIVAFDGKEITVNAINRNYSSGNEFIQPSSGKEFVKVDVTLKNTTSEKISYNVLDWKYEDEDGNMENFSIMAQPDNDFGSGELAANGKKTGSIVFEVKQNSSLKIHYSPSFWSDKDIIITEK